MSRRGVRAALACAALGTSLAAACERESFGDAPYAREIAESVPRIEEATGRKFKRPPVVEARTREQVHAFLLRKFDETTPARQIAGEESAYKLLGLVPDSLDLRAFFLRVLGEQVVGYYDPAEKKLYVVEGADEQMVGITITHELVHALQDQYVNLDSLQKSTTDNDRLTALQAVIEGEAQYEQMSIMVGGAKNLDARLPGGWERIREAIREGQSSMPIFATAPMVIQESLLFPYLGGADFVRRSKERNAGANLFANVPRSTEQLLHSDAFFGASPDEPTRVSLPAPRGATALYDNDMGEFATRLFLYQHIGDAAAAARAAAGWDGDRFMIVEGRGARGIVWASVWDSALEAAEFSDAAIRATTRRTGAAERRLEGGGTSFGYKGRTVSIRPVAAGDRQLVVYSDLPDAMGDVVPPGAVRLTP